MTESYFGVCPAIGRQAHRIAKQTPIDLFQELGVATVEKRSFQLIAIWECAVVRTQQTDGHLQIHICHAQKLSPGRVEMKSNLMLELTLAALDIAVTVN